MTAWLSSAAIRRTVGDGAGVVKGERGACSAMSSCVMLDGEIGDGGSARVDVPGLGDDARN
eukprot:2915256-Pyramimonas_sp.AAC.1